MPQKRSIAHIYNPSQQTPQDLINGFVVRKEVFQELFKAVKQNQLTKSAQHYIVEGQRGMGKTTLLLRLYHEIKRDESLKPWLLPIVFKEEEYGISSLFDFWLTITDYLAEEYIAFTALSQLEIPHDSLEKSEAFIFQALLDKLKAEEKRLVLFIDNLGDILSRWSVDELTQFQQVLKKHPQLQIIGASSYAMEDFFVENQTKTFYSKIFQPFAKTTSSIFYQHFKPIALYGLNADDNIMLLSKLGELYHDQQIQQILISQPQRVEALRRLTGGVIRTIVLLYEIFVDEEGGDTFLDLELILDRVTPLYKHRMDDLPAQQQKIVHAIAMHWDAISTKEIAQQTLIPSKVISAQLRKLEKSGWIDKVKTNTKNHLYLLTERFFNIWYLMRMGRHIGRSRVRWLVSFFEAWCQNHDELGSRAQQHIRAMGNQAYNPRAAYFISEALANVTFIDWELQEQLLKKTKDFLDKTDQSLSHKLSKPSRELFTEARDLYKTGQYSMALERLTRIQNKNDYVYEMMGSIYHYNIRDTEQAKNCYLKSIEESNREIIYWQEVLLGSENSAEKFHPDMLKQILDLNQQKVRVTERKKGLTSLSLAMLYVEINQEQEAEKLYPSILKIGTTNTVYFLADFLFRQRMDQELAYRAVNLAIKREAKLNYLSLKAKIELWLGDLKGSLKTAEGFLYDLDFILDQGKLHQEYLMMLIAMGQHAFVLNYFKEQIPDKARWGNAKFKEVCRPLYFAQLYFLKDKDVMEYLRMGGELRDTVNEIIQRIMELQRLYIPNKEL